MMPLFTISIFIFFLLTQVYSVWQNGYVITCFHYASSDTNYLSTNLQICRENWHQYPLILYLQSQMVRLDTIKHLLIQQMLNCWISLFWLAGCVPSCLKAHYPRQICDPPSLLLSQSIKYRQSYFFEDRELSALCIKVFYAQPFS